jgi:pSer/pThr/pTyr-binding forkhead associated (FHA) protein
MRVQCPHCGAKLHLDEERFADGRPSQVTCWMCTLPIELSSSPIEPGPQTIAVSSSAPHERYKDSRLEGVPNSQTADLALPQDKLIRISVIAGSSQGMEYELSRPLMTIGRLGGGADIEIDDLKVSRVHCAVEVRRDAILLHDLRSTNGTYLGNSRVFNARLEEMSKFRIGSSFLRVSVRSKTSNKGKGRPPDMQRPT